MIFVFIIVVLRKHDMHSRCTKMILILGNAELSNVVCKRDIEKTRLSLKAQHDETIRKINR